MKNNKLTRDEINAICSYLDEIDIDSWDFLEMLFKKDLNKPLKFVLGEVLKDLNKPEEIHKLIDKLLGN